jgi:hypothetical protein
MAASALAANCHAGAPWYHVTTACRFPDPHDCGNWYVTGDGRMGLYDWQCIVRGGWARDVAYALSSHLTAEQRRHWEHDLIDRYCGRLAEAGRDVPSPAAAFLAYRQQMMHGMTFWLMTAALHLRPTRL